MNRNDEQVDFIFSVKGMPLRKFKEWDEECRKEYSDIRWVKLWSDHQRNKLSESIEMLQMQIEMLKQELKDLYSKIDALSVEETEEKVQTLGSD